MAQELNKQVALITGAARGVGRATALRLARAGCDIIINYYNSSDLASQLATEIEAMGVAALTIQANVSEPDSVNEMMQAVSQRYDHIDILVSNAASGVLKPAMEMKLKHWRWCLETNAYALPLLVQQAKSLLQPGARVIAVSSLGAIRSLPNYSYIAASKAALESLVRSLSFELAADDIRINAVSPGLLNTDAIKYFPERERLFKLFAERALTKTELTPAHVADTIYLLCLPEAAMIKGQTIFVDAGYATVG